MSLFAARLKDLRKERDISQSEFAKQICMSKQNVSDWERGKAETSFDMAIKIAQFFGITVGQLFGSEDLYPQKEKL